MTASMLPSATLAIRFDLALGMLHRLKVVRTTSWVNC